MSSIQLFSSSSVAGHFIYTTACLFCKMFHIIQLSTSGQIMQQTNLVGFNAQNQKDFQKQKKQVSKNRHFNPSASATLAKLSIDNRSHMTNLDREKKTLSLMEESEVMQKSCRGEFIAILKFHMACFCSEWKLICFLTYKKTHITINQLFSFQV